MNEATLLILNIDIDAKGSNGRRERGDGIAQIIV